MIGLINDLAGKLLIRKCIDQPILITGSGRSGTSILLQALGKHPNILSMSGEAPFLTSIGGNASLFHYANNSAYYQKALQVDLHYLLRNLSRLGLESAGGKHFAINRFLDAIKNGDKNIFKKTSWCAKTFPTNNVANGLKDVYPNVRFIHIVRNGIFVVHSMTKFHGFKDQDFPTQCKIWSDSVEKYRYMKDLPNAICLKHEQLLSNPIRFFEETFTFLNINKAEECANFVKTNLVHPLNMPTTSTNDAIHAIANRQSPHKLWTSSQKDQFKSICASAMDEEGYPVPF